MSNLLPFGSPPPKWKNGTTANSITNTNSGNVGIGTTGPTTAGLVVATSVSGASIDAGSQRIISVADPTGVQDAATKSYVDAVAQGLSAKGSVILATAVALPTNTYLAGVITMTATGTLTVDGTVTALNDRILVKNEVAQLGNGVYKVTTAGAIGVAAVLTRSTDMDVSAEFPGAYVFTEIGTVNAGAGFVCTNSTPPTVGTTAITFTQFSGAGQITAGAAMTKSGNTLDVAVDGSTIEVSSNALRVKDSGITVAKLGGDITTAGKALLDDADNTAQRTTLGLGTLATQSGTFSGTSSGTNTGDQTSVTGNAGTATALATPRAINGVNFDGTAAITVPAAFWTTVPGTPTRVSDTQFTITDTANANLYDLMFKKGVIIKWDESGTFQTGMVISSSYATNTVTINIVGDSLTAGFTLMKYAIPMARQETFIIPGTLPAVTDIAKTYYAPADLYVLSADAYVKTAGTTNSTVFDINDDGTTLFTTKPTITTGTTSDIDNTSTAASTAVAAGSLVTVDIDSVSTTAPIEAYIYVFYYPVSWRYRT